MNEEVLKKLKIDDCILLTYLGEKYDIDFKDSTVIAIVKQSGTGFGDMIIKVISDNALNGYEWKPGEIKSIDIENFIEGSPFFLKIEIL